MLFALRITLESCPILPDLPVLLSWKIGACATYHYYIYTYTQHRLCRVIGAVIHRFTLPMPFHLTRHYLPVTYTSFLSRFLREITEIHIKYQAYIPKGSRNPSSSSTNLNIYRHFILFSYFTGTLYKFIFTCIRVSHENYDYRWPNHIFFLNFLEKAANCWNIWNICGNKNPPFLSTNLYQCFVSPSCFWCIMVYM